MSRDICEQYLEALNKGSLSEILSLFDSDAVVVSPLYGEITAVEFYTGLLADTGRSQTRLLHIYGSNSGDPSWALRFHYSWTLKNGKVVEFECVDIIDVNPASSKIGRLKIIYDTAPLRDDFIKSKSECS